MSLLSTYYVPSTLLNAENMIADAVFIPLYIIMANICVFSMFQALSYLLNMHCIIWSSYQSWVTIILLLLLKVTQMLENLNKVSRLKVADPGESGSRIQVLSLYIKWFLSPVLWAFMLLLLRQETLI